MASVLRGREADWPESMASLPACVRVPGRDDRIFNPAPRGGARRNARGRAWYPRPSGTVTTLNTENFPHLQLQPSVLCWHCHHENNLVGACRCGVLFHCLRPVCFFQPLLQYRDECVLRWKWPFHLLQHVVSAGGVVGAAGVLRKSRLWLRATGACCLCGLPATCDSESLLCAREHAWGRLSPGTAGGGQSGVPGAGIPVAAVAAAHQCGIGRDAVASIVTAEDGHAPWPRQRHHSLASRPRCLLCTWHDSCFNPWEIL